MKLHRKALVLASGALLLAVAGCKAPQIAVRGDSTAIGSLAGLKKVYNLAPSLDGDRWWVCMGRKHGWTVFNDGVGGQSVFTMRDKAIENVKVKGLPTIIYDRRNDGESAADYISALDITIKAIGTDKFLIMPQVTRAEHREKDDYLPVMAAIDAEVLRRWPDHTFDPATRARFIAALDAPSTRMDGLHRNEAGQKIECQFVDEWVSAKGWLS